MRMFNIWLDKDVEKTHGIRFAFAWEEQQNKGISFNIQWRSWDCDENGYDPWMLHFDVFVWGTFLGFHPHCWGRKYPLWFGSCCSNGVTLFSWTPIG